MSTWTGPNHKSKSNECNQKVKEQQISSKLLERFKDATDGKLWQEQAGFRCGRTCSDQIFILQQILEKVTTKTFHSVHRPSLEYIIEEYRIEEDLVEDIASIIRNLYEDSQNAVKWNGVIPEGSQCWWAWDKDAHCHHSPLLFTLAIDWIVKKTFNRPECGIGMD